MLPGCVATLFPVAMLSSSLLWMKCATFLAVAMLKKMGTYAGQDAIVAFARLYGVNVVIHQLNSPVWTVSLHARTHARTRARAHTHTHTHTHVTQPFDLWLFVSVAFCTIQEEKKLSLFDTRTLAL